MPLPSPLLPLCAGACAGREAAAALLLFQGGDRERLQAGSTVQGGSRERRQAALASLRESYAQAVADCGAACSPGTRPEHAWNLTPLPTPTAAVTPGLQGAGQVAAAAGAYIYARKWLVKP